MKHVRGPAELLQAREQLAGLMEATDKAIGGVASHGYKQLDALSGGRRSSPEGIHSVGGFFQPRRITQEPFSFERTRLSNTNATVAGVSTETYRSQHITKKGKPVLSLPVRDRIVAVELKDNNPGGVLTGLAQVSVKGDVGWNNKSVSPRGLYGDLGAGLLGYGSGDQLQADYTRAFTSRLAITGLVAASLLAAHEIESDLSALSDVAAQWQETDARAYSSLNEQFAAFLPNLPAVE